MEWWQNLPLNINPIFLDIGPLQIRYYGLMFLSAFVCFYILMRWRIKHDQVSLSIPQLDDVLVWVVVGALAGGRLGYVVFYDFFYFLEHPLQMIWPFHQSGGESYFGISGLSYHGGLLGVILACVIFCRKHQLDLWTFADGIMPAVPLGYTFGRLGNFLNGELYGRITEKPWGMYFPDDLGLVMRHPSQLYEAFLEGIFIFIILWGIRNHKRFSGLTFWLYLVLYGTVRFVIEYFRQPDEHLGLLVWDWSMGQYLCAVMVVVGVFEIWRRSSNENYRRT